MQTLDFGEIMEKNPHWFAKYTLSCPYCRGQGSYRCQTCGGEGFVECLDCESSGQVDGQDCPKCGGVGYWDCEDCDDPGVIPCEHCTEGYFEVMWNTAFEVKVWDDYLDVDHGDSKWNEAYKFAWDMGFCLIEHGRKRYLLMGMCGLDCTWIIHYTRWKLQGFLDDDDCYQCLGSGGYVFLSDERRRELCEYIKDRLTPPEDYAKTYERYITKIDRIMSKTEI